MYLEFLVSIEKSTIETELVSQKIKYIAEIWTQCNKLIDAQQRISKRQSFVKRSIDTMRNNTTKNLYKSFTRILMVRDHKSEHDEVKKFPILLFDYPMANVSKFTYVVSVACAVHNHSLSHRPSVVEDVPLIFCFSLRWYKYF